MSIYNALWGLFAAGLAWVTLEFIGRPLRRFYDLRGQAKTLLLLYGHYAPDVKPQAEFEDIGRKRVAYQEFEPIIEWLIHLLGFDPKRAGHAFRNLTEYWGVRYTDYDAYFNEIKIGLKLKEKIRKDTKPKW